MRGRFAAVAAGAAVALVASLALGPGDVRASGRDDDDREVIEKRVVVRHGGGRLGVSIRDTSGDTRGAEVRSVAEDSAAAKAGIKEGDVITRFDGEAVRSAGQLGRLVAETPGGRTVAIEVSRGGATQKLQATLAEGGGSTWAFSGEWPHVRVPDFDVVVPHAPPAPPAPPRAPRPGHPNVWSWNDDDGRAFHFELLGGGPRKLGIEYMELGEQLAAYFKLEGKSGVLVTAVDADGPAAKAGMKAGDVILKLAGETVADGGDLREALSEAEGGSEVTVSVQRDGRAVELKVTLAKPRERKQREARGVSL